MIAKLAENKLSAWSSGEFNSRKNESNFFQLSGGYVYFPGNNNITWACMGKSL